MHNRRLVEHFYKKEEKRLAPSSIKTKKSRIKSLLEFFDQTLFQKGRAILPDFLEFITSDERGLKPGYIQDILSESRQFLGWLKRQRHVTVDYQQEDIDDLKILKHSFGPEPTKKYYSIEQIEKIAATPVCSLVEERTRASALHLFATGQRITAFVTTPLSAVDYERMTVNQDPAVGVVTKINKAAKTCILPLECLDVARAWDVKVRKIYGSKGLWYPNLLPDNRFDMRVPTSLHRDAGFRKDLKKFLTKAEVPYFGCHGFRHGFIRYLRDRAKTEADLEVVAYHAMQEFETMLSYAPLNQDNAYDGFFAFATRDSSSEPTMEHIFTSLIQEINQLRSEIHELKH
jgi:site-specific recombinase XerD